MITNKTSLSAIQYLTTTRTRSITVVFSWIANCMPHVLLRLRCCTPTACRYIDQLVYNAAVHAFRAHRQNPRNKQDQCLNLSLIPVFPGYHLDSPESLQSVSRSQTFLQYKVENLDRAIHMLLQNSL